MVGLEYVFALIKFTNARVKIIQNFSYVLGADTGEQIVFAENINIPVHNCVNNP